MGYPGDDFLIVDNVVSAEECSRICGKHPACKSWTYGKKPGQSYTKRCFLKSSVKPGRHQSDCCDSGLPCQETFPEGICTTDSFTHVLANGDYNPDCCGKPRTGCDSCSCGRSECCTDSARR